MSRNISGEEQDESSHEMNLGIPQPKLSGNTCQSCGKSFSEHNGIMITCRESQERLDAIRECYKIAIRKADPELRSICEKILAKV